MTCALSFVISGQKLLKIVQMTWKYDTKCVKKKKQMSINKDEVMDLIHDKSSIISVILNLWMLICGVWGMSFKDL